MIDPTSESPADASRTALGVAVHRAAHRWLDDPPPILDDPVSGQLVGPEAEAFVRGHAERYLGDGARRLRSSLVVRSRFAEDELARAIACGTRQAVVLGAGLDTFAYRQPEWASKVRIVELDHAASQASKRARLAIAGIAVPANVSLAPVDLVRDDLPPALAAAGIDLRAPVFLLWLGVMMYLPADANDRILRSVARLSPGSGLVLSFAHPAHPARDPVAQAAASQGEPWLDRPGPDALLRRLHAAGFRTAEVVPADTLRERYFAGRIDLPAPARSSIAIAFA